MIIDQSSSWRTRLKRWLFLTNALLLQRGRLSEIYYQLLYILESIVEVAFIYLFVRRPYLVESFSSQMPRNAVWLACTVSTYLAALMLAYLLRNTLSVCLQVLHFMLLMASVLISPMLVLLVMSIGTFPIWCTVLIAVGLPLVLLIVVLYHLIHFEVAHSLSSSTKYLNSSFLWCRLFYLLTVLLAVAGRQIPKISILANLFWMLGYAVECYRSVFQRVIQNPRLAHTYSLTVLIRLNFCLSLLLLNAQSNLLNDNQYVFLLIMLAFQTKFYFTYNRSFTISTFEKEIKWFDSEIDCEIYLREFLMLKGKHARREDGFYYLGIIKRHQQFCLDANCRCRNMDHNNCSFEFLMVLIDGFRKGQPDSYSLKIHQVEAYAQFSEAYPRAFYLIERLGRSTDKRITRQWVEWNVRKRIFKKAGSHDKAPSSELAVIKYESLNKMLHTELKSMLANCIKKATLLMESVVVAVTLETICQKQIVSMEAINSLYQKICESCPHALEVRRLIFDYTMNVLFDNEVASKVQKDISNVHNTISEKIEEHALAEYCRDIKACVVELEKSQESLGIISYCSDQFKNIFGISSTQIIGKHFTTLFPKQVEADFRAELKGWFATGEWPLLHCPKEFIMQNNCGSLLMVKGFARVSFGEDNFRLLVWMKMDFHRHVGLLDTEGRIVGLGAKLKQICRITDTFFQVFCPEFSTIVNNLDAMEPEVSENHEFFMFIPSPSEIEAMKADYSRLQLSTPDCSLTSIREFMIYHQKNIIKSSSLQLVHLSIQTIKGGGSRYILISFQGCRKCTFQNFLDCDSIDPELRKYGAEHFEGVSQKQLVLLNHPQISAPKTSAFGPLQTGLSYIGDLMLQQQKDYMQSLQGMSLSSFDESEHNQSRSSYESSCYDYSFKNIMRIVRETFLRPKSSLRLKVATVLVLFSGTILVGILLSQYFIGIDGLDSYMDVIFADAAVSDNMQLLEMFYNKAILFYQYFSESAGQRFAYLLRNCRSLMNYLYDLIVLDHKRIHLDVTYNGRQFYEYIKIKVPLDINNGFMEWYYKSIWQLTFDMEARNFTTRSQEGMDVLVSNWNAMKSMNHGNLYHYNLIGVDLINLVAMQTYILLAVFIVTSAFFATVFYSLQLKAQLRLNDSLNLHEHLTPSDVVLCCSGFERFITTTNVGKEMMPEVKKLIQQGESKATLKKTFLRKPVKGNIGWYLLLFALLNTANLINSGSVLLFLTPCQNMMDSINSLMDSENYQLEAYFDLKTYYLYDQFGVDQATFTRKFLQEVNSQEVQFVRVAINSISIFGEYDPDYITEFTQLLISDICEVTMAAELQDWEREKCRTGFNTDIIKHGILAAMAAMKRITVETAVQLNRTGIAAAPTLFKGPLYEDLDDSIIYMFKVFQITQAKMVTAMNKAMAQRKSIMVSVAVLEAVLIISMMLVWAVVFRREIEIEKKRHGFVLLLSPEVVSTNKLIRSCVLRSITTGPQR